MNKEKITYPQQDRWSYLWLLIGTALGFLWLLPIALWLSPIFILRFARSQKVWRGFILVVLTTFAVFALTLSDMMPMPMPIFLVTMAITALLVGGLPVLADRLLVPRLNGFVATLVYPLAVTMMDYIGAMTNPAGSLGAQAYTQYGNLAFMQLLSITGMWGIVFLVSWLGPVVNWAWERGFQWQKIWRGAAVFVTVLLLVLFYGQVRLAYADMPTETVRMHGINPVNASQTWGEMNQLIAEEGWQAMREKTAETHNIYFEDSIREARAGAQLVHWPEMAVMVAKEDEAAFVARAQQISQEEGVYLAMAIGVQYEGDSSLWENKLIITAPSGEVVLEHYKYGNQSAEGFKPGDAILRAFETPFGTVSGIICNDTNHQEVLTQAGRNGTDILLSPSLEFPAIDPMHAYMAIYRAIENGVTLVRQADNGRSLVADPYGHILAEVDFFASSDRVMVAQVPADSSVFTLYSYIGDAFAWLSMAGFALLVGIAFIQGRREKVADPAEVLAPA